MAIITFIEYKPRSDRLQKQLDDTEARSHAARVSHANRRRQRKGRQQITLKRDESSSSSSASEDSLHSDDRWATVRYLSTDDWVSRLASTKLLDMAPLRQHMRLFWKQGYIRHMAPILSEDIGTTAAMAYLASSSLDALYNTRESVVSLAVKGQAVHGINRSLNDVSSATSGMNLLALAGVASAVNNYEMGVGSEYPIHRQAIETLMMMKIQRADPKNETSPLDRIVNRAMNMHRYALPAIYGLELPVPEYPAHDFEYEDVAALRMEDSASPKPFTLESPFYCPLKTFVYIQKSKYYHPLIVHLMSDTRDYTTCLLEDHDSASSLQSGLQNRLSLRDQILSYRSIHQARDGRIPALSDRDYIYESTRLTSLALVHLSDTCLPAREAFLRPRLTDDHRDLASLLELEEALADYGFTSAQISPISSPPPFDIIPALAYNLRKTPNPVLGWGALDGVLFWILFLGTTISRAQKEYCLFASVLAKHLLDMVWGDDGRGWNDGFVPLKTWIEFQRRCMEGKVKKLTCLARYAGSEAQLGTSVGDRFGSVELDDGGSSPAWIIPER